MQYIYAYDVEDLAYDDDTTFNLTTARQFLDENAIELRDITEEYTPFLIHDSRSQAPEDWVKGHVISDGNDSIVSNMLILRTGDTGVNTALLLDPNLDDYEDSTSYSDSLHSLCTALSIQPIVCLFSDGFLGVESQAVKFSVDVFTDPLSPLFVASWMDAWTPVNYSPEDYTGSILFKPSSSEMFEFPIYTDAVVPTREQGPNPFQVDRVLSLAEEYL